MASDDSGLIIGIILAIVVIVVGVLGYYYLYLPASYDFSIWTASGDATWFVYGIVAGLVIGIAVSSYFSSR